MRQCDVALLCLSQERQTSVCGSVALGAAWLEERGVG